jgi:hypothetical protein
MARGTCIGSIGGRGLLALALAAGLAACRTAGGVSPATGVTAGAPLPSALEVLASLRAGAARRRSVQAEGTVTYFGARGRVRGRAVIVARRPGSFRVETLSPLEQPVEVICSDGAQLHVLSGDVLRVGPATPEEVYKVIPLPMRSEEVVDTLIGGVPTSERFAPARVSRGEDGRLVLGLDGPAGERVELTVDPSRRVVERSRLLGPDGALRVEVQFDGFEPAEDAGPPLPRSIVARMPGADLDLRIRLSEVVVDGAVDDALFRLEPRPGEAPLPLGGS